MNSKEKNDNEKDVEKTDSSLNEEVNQLKVQINELTLISNNSKEFLLILEKELRQKEEERNSEISELRFLRKNKRQLESKIKHTGIEVEKIERAKNRAEKENKFLSKKVEYLEEDIRKLRKENEIMKSSASWKVTKPLRKLTQLKK